MEFVNNETGKTVATLPDITKADEKAWALDPKKHYKYRERQQEIKDAKKKGVAKTRLPKAIKPEYLVEIN